MRKSENPCYGCTFETGRYYGCHDRCEKRLEYVKLCEAEKAYTREHIQADNDMASSIRRDSTVWNDKKRNLYIGRH